LGILKTVGGNCYQNIRWARAGTASGTQQISANQQRSLIYQSGFSFDFASTVIPLRFAKKTTSLICISTQ